MEEQKILNWRNEIFTNGGMKNPQLREQNFHKWRKSIEVSIKRWYYLIGDDAMKYRKRVTDNLINRKLRGKGAVLVQGAKWCGKTTSCEQVAGSTLYLADPANERQNIILADINPELLLQGKTPRLIDEWQIAPKLWDAIRFEVDHRREEGQFILTGSAVPGDLSEIKHSGTGRFAWITMRTMSLFESDESTGEVSLGDLFSTPQQIAGINDKKIEDLAFLACRGGWPRAIDMDDDIALDQAFNYYDAIVNTDISRVDGVHRNSGRVKNLMRAYTRNQGKQVSAANLRKDMLANDSENMSVDTVNSYINALKKIFVVEEAPAWNPNLRSKAAIRTTDTRYFTDPSIGTAAMGIGPNDLLQDLNTFGFVFESMCVRDLRIYADALNGKVYHYRDSNDLECDAVVHLRNGDYGLIEIKLGGERLIEAGAESLKKLADTIDTSKMKNPSFLMVLVGVGQYAYRRPDGVYVVPLGCLAP